MKRICVFGREQELAKEEKAVIYVASRRHESIKIVCRFTSQTLPSTERCLWHWLEKNSRYWGILKTELILPVLL